MNPADTYGVWLESLEYDHVPPIALANLGKTQGDTSLQDVVLTLWERELTRTADATANTSKGHNWGRS